MVEEDKPDDRYPLYFLYSYDRGNAVGFVQALVKKGFVIENPKFREIGPTIGTHIGPNGFGVVYVSQNESEESYGD